MIDCYLFNLHSFSERKGEVRDAPLMRILECNECWLISFNSNSHIQSGFYQNSGMHGDEPDTMRGWLQETYGDNERRFEELMSLLPNKRILDFGCVAGGLLAKAKSLVSMMLVWTWKDAFRAIGKTLKSLSFLELTRLNLNWRS